MFESWRGIVGDVKPTHRPGSLEDFIRLLPEGIDVPFKDVGRLSGEEIYSHAKKAFLKHPDAQAIYMLGSGWRLLKIVRLLEQDLRVPVIYALACKLWDVQKQLHVHEPVKGYGRLLEELP